MAIGQDDMDDIDDYLWVLRYAARRAGFAPHARSTVDLLISLEGKGLVRASDKYPVWYITDKGRAMLASAQEG